jgi:hypothetical protein
MKRAAWSVPCATVAWFLLGFGPWFFGSQDAMAPWSEREFLPLTGAGMEVVVIGAAVGGIVAGLIVGRLRIAVPLTVALGAVLWLLARAHQAGQTPDNGIMATLLVCTGVGAVLGAFGSRRSVLAAVAVALPVALYALLPGSHLSGRDWVTDLDSLLVAIGFALILYVACWRGGWRGLPSWPVVTAAYLVSFALMTSADAVAERFRAGRQTTDAVAAAATDSFVHAFRPFLATYWPWLVAAAFLAVMMVALKIRAIPPVRPEIPYDDRPNDAFLPDDLDWFDRPEPRRRLIPRRDPVGS